MTKKEFMNSIGHAREDILGQMLDLLHEMKIDYCVIGGLAANAYVEPVVSLDLDIVIVAEAVERFLEAAKKIFHIERFPHNLNLSSPKSDLRIQLQTDPRYQSFLPRSLLKDVMGYEMRVAAVEDVLQGKIWAYLDEQRRRSKRQKDLADIFRIVESYPELRDLLPENIRNMEF
ncbi:MAG: nucleotidyl transferase AbiEii/AbiGii toxin family protein [Calditrichaeota bacterium]|nr:nucleotidyl transferase AbiEii/AbiGii toxin family protein [Calditrichota bacterium]